MYYHWPIVCPSNSQTKTTSVNRLSKDENMAEAEKDSLVHVKNEDPIDFNVLASNKAF